MVDIDSVTCTALDCSGISCYLSPFQVGPVLQQQVIKGRVSVVLVPFVFSACGGKFCLLLWPGWSLELYDLPALSC